MSKANQNNKYVKVVILHANTPDYNDIALTEHEIREIQANMQNINFDIEHSHNYLDGISIKQNYVSKTEETINNTTINKGSWLMVLGVTNQMVLAGIENGDLNGVSLETDFTTNVKVKPNGTEVVPYKDVETKEELIPHVVSFTGRPANMMPLELMTHQQYTRKHIQKNGGQNMTEQNNQTEEVSWLRSVIEKLTTPQHTSKNIGVSTGNIPESQPMMGQETEELVQGLIESQKMIPTIAKSMETVAQSNARMSEAFNNMSARFDQVLVQESNTIGGGNNGTTPNENEENNIPNEPTPSNNNEEELDENLQGGTNNTEPTSNENTEEEGLTPEEEETLKKLQEKQAKHTRKNIQGGGLTPPSFTPLNTEEEYTQTKEYVANRTFDYFMKGGQ